MKTIIIDKNSVGIRQVENICPVLLIGNFDGVHKGHQSLIKHAKSLADKNNTSLAVMSFNPHPGYFFQKEHSAFSIISQEFKVQLLKEQDVDYFYNVSFDSFTANTSAKDFIENFLYKTIEPSCVIVGENFRFGKGREGDIQLLKELGSKHSMKVYIAELIEDKNKIISSSLIRKSLENGDIQKANNLLGWNWFIELKITKITSDNYIIVKPIDEKIISIKTGKYNASIKSTKNNKDLVFSLHELDNSIKLSLQKEQPTHLYVVGDIINLYPKNICCANKKEIRSIT